MHEDQRLLAAVARGPADPLPPVRAEFVLHNLMKLGAVDVVGDVFELREVQAAHAVMRGFAAHKADEAEKRDSCGMHVIAHLDGVDNTAKTTWTAAGKNNDGNGESDEADQYAEE